MGTAGAHSRLIDSGGDWDRRNRLKVYRAVHQLSIRNFVEAADLLIDSLSTFTATELMEYEEFVGLTVLAAGVGCDRKGIKSKVRRSARCADLRCFPPPRLRAALPRFPISPP